jgi:hypothetical protein
MICWAARWTTAIVMEMMMMMMMMMGTMRYRETSLMKKWSSPTMMTMMTMMTALLLIGPGECSTSCISNRAPSPISRHRRCHFAWIWDFSSVLTVAQTQI